MRKLIAYRAVGTQFWSCTRKVRHKTVHDARKAALATPDKSGHSVQPYQCKYCKGWHVGNVKCQP